MGLANWLTVLRILLIPVFVTLLVYRRPGTALAVFCLASLTDLLDGYVARSRGSQSRLGAFLDPMADKLLLTASFVTLTYLHRLPFWITAVVISRDVILVLGAVLIHMTGGQIYPSPTRAGKLSTFFQILTVLAAMLMPYIRAPLALTAPAMEATSASFRSDTAPLAEPFALAAPERTCAADGTVSRGPTARSRLSSSITASATYLPRSARTFAIGSVSNWRSSGRSILASRLAISPRRVTSP